MCLSDVYQISEGCEPQQLASKASEIKVQNDTIIINDIFGNEQTVRGYIEDVDLLENKILIRSLS